MSKVENRNKALLRPPLFLLAGLVVASGAIVNFPQHIGDRISSCKGVEVNKTIT